MAIHRTNVIENEIIKSQTRSASDAWKLIALALGFVMATLDATVVNVATVSIQKSMNIGLSGLTWVVDGYILTFASLLLLAGSLANRFGAKTMYLTGVFLFVLASLFSAIATNSVVLITARLVQGASAALFMPSSLSLLAMIYTDEKKRAKMFGIWSAIVSIASGLGPFVGGVLVNTFGWKSIFLINLPIGIIGFLLTYRIIPASVHSKTPLSFISHGLGVLALSGISFTLIEGPSYGWKSSYIMASAIVGLVSLALYILKEAKSKAPIIPVKLFRDPNFSVSNIVGFLLNFSLYGEIFMLSLFLQYARNTSPFMAGTELLPMMIVFVVGNLLFARITKRLGTRAPMLVSLCVAGIGSLVMISISPNTEYWILAVVIALVNLGVGVTVPAMTATVMQAAGRENANVAGATLNANRQIGALVGIAVMGVILRLSQGWYSGAKYTFLVMTIAYFLAAFLVWKFIRTKVKKKSSLDCKI